MGQRKKMWSEVGFWQGTGQGEVGQCSLHDCSQFSHLGGKDLKELNATLFQSGIN